MVGYDLLDMAVINFKSAKNVGFRYPVTLIGSNNISIGENTTFGKFCILSTWEEYVGDKFTPIIEIGRDCNFGEYNHLTAINKITIGNNVLTGRWVTITDNSHGKTDIETLSVSPIKRHLYSKGEIIIEDNVWIGDKATILPGVTIGKSAVIAANAVVTKDIPAYSVAAGNPAKIIKSSSCV